MEAVTETSGYELDSYMVITPYENCMKEIQRISNAEKGLIYKTIYDEAEDEILYLLRGARIKDPDDPMDKTPSP